jgi:cobalamin biosynthesis Mg chelatase CobN
MSVIALLALACFPVFAQAECVSSSCVQYTESIPKAEGESPPAHHKHPAVAKAADNGGASAPDGKAGAKGSDGEKSESSEKESSSEEGGVATAGKGNGGGTGQGNPGGSANSGSQGQVQHGGQSAGTPASQSSGGGSSPLVPILVGIAILAAISVGVVMYRQRRQRRGPTASTPSPKAS